MLTVCCVCFCKVNKMSQIKWEPQLSPFPRGTRSSVYFSRPCLHILDYLFLTYCSAWHVFFKLTGVCITLLLVSCFVFCPFSVLSHSDVGHGHVFVHDTPCEPCFLCQGSALISSPPFLKYYQGFQSQGHPNLLGHEVDLSLQTCSYPVLQGIWEIVNTTETLHACICGSTGFLMCGSVPPGRCLPSTCTSLAPGTSPGP